MVAGVLAEFSRACDALVAVDVASLSNEELRGFVRSLAACMDRPRAAYCAAVKVIDERQAYLEAGSSSTVSFLRSALRIDGGEASEQVKVALHLGALPQAQAALREGAIGFGHAKVLARSVEAVGGAELREREGMLLQVALDGDAQELQKVTGRVRHEADAKQVLLEANRRYEKRALRIRQNAAGMGVLEWVMDPECDAMVRTAITALMQPMRNEARSRAQRRSDAMQEIVARQLAGGGLPRRGSVAPQLQVMVPAEGLKDGVGGELVGVGPVTPEFVQRMACEAAVCCVLHDEDGSPMDSTKLQRNVAAPSKRALRARDKGCVFPRCGMGVDYCVVHHWQVRWHDGGYTRMSNLCLVCRFHHRLVHEGGWTLRLISGTWQALKPGAHATSATSAGEAPVEDLPKQPAVAAPSGRSP